MTARTYAVGVVLLAVCLAPLAVGAIRVRRASVPSWRGLPARLADTTIMLLLLLGVLHVLGAVGQFRRGPVVAGCIVVGLAAALVANRHGPSTSSAPPTPSPLASPRWAVLVMIPVLVVLVAQWASGTIASVRHGISDYDSLWYHLPHAARFVQDGWITPLHFTRPEFPSMFHPADGELLHAFGMLLFKGDLLSPFINDLWLALTLAAAWCIGRPRGFGPLAVILTAVVLATPEMAALQAGSALNDIATVCSMLLVAAFLVQPARDRAATLLAGAAAGLAIGIKLTMLAPIAALTIGIVLLARRGERLRTALAWVVVLTATGGFWHLRNLALVGSPVPGLRLGPLPAGDFQTVDDLGFNIAHYLFNGAVWSDWFLPALRNAIGNVWWLVFAIAAVSLAVVLAKGRAEHRLAAVVAVAGIVGYILMPTSAMGTEGRPFLFFATLRYGFPGLALAIVLMATIPQLRHRVLHVGVVGLGVAAFAATEVTHDPAWRSWRDDDLLLAVAIATALVGAGTLAMWLARHRPARSASIALLLAATATVVGVGYLTQRTYASMRAARSGWATGLHTRIGIVGSDLQYDDYGPILENAVQYVGTVGPYGEFHDIGSCEEWRDSLGKGRYGYADVWFSTGRFDPSLPVPSVPQLEWTRSDPAAQLVLEQGAQSVFRLDGSSNGSTCSPR